jgi:transposase InsO family protein
MSNTTPGCNFGEWGLHKVLIKLYFFKQKRVPGSTRFVWLFPLPDDQTLTIARYLHGLFLTFGFPKIMQSDRGGAFVSKIIDAICSLGSIDQRLILPYNPRTNGIIEIQVRIMKKVLYKELEGALQSWCIFIPAIMYFMNKKVSEVTGTTPFAVLFGRAPNPFKDYSGQEITEVEQLQHRIDFMNHASFPRIYAHSLAVIKGRQDNFLQQTESYCKISFF